MLSITLTATGTNKVNNFKAKARKYWKAFCKFNQGLAQGAGYALRH